MRLTGNDRGFSLIELLVVITIIGLLAAIAIPSFLGTRDKAKQKAVIASAKYGESEIRTLKWAFVAKESFLALDSSSNMKCFESLDAENNNKCSTAFPDVVNVGTYDSSDMEFLVDIAVDNFAGKNLSSPYGVSPHLFVDHDGTIGTIAISTVGNRSLKICAYGLNTSTPLYNSIL